MGIGSRSLVVLGLVAGVAASVVPMAAADVILNPGFGVMSTNTASVTRYRISNTNWDTFIGSSSTVSTSTIVQSANLGTQTALNTLTWDFAYAYTSGVGYTWTLSRAGTTSTMSWTAPTANGPNPTAAFNAISIAIIAGTAMPAGVTSASASATNLAFNFSSGGAPITGSLRDLASTWTPSGSSGQDRIMIFSDTDLSTTSWSLTGKVQFTYSGTAGGSLDERLKLDVATMAAIPQPAGVLAFGAIACLGLRRSRRA